MLTACLRTEPAAAPGASAAALTLPPGFRAELYAEGLRGPTALAWGPDGALYITQINGDENAATGQVVVVAEPGAAPVAVLESLAKPTGLAWRDELLYIVAGRDVVETGRDPAGTFTAPRPLVTQLPFNSRSEGQIDVLPDGRLLFEASGAVNDAQSGRLFTLLPGDQPAVLATGLKNAYAYAIDPAGGALYTTDIHDEAVNGGPPADEINLVLAQQDYGWPRCNGEREPARNLGGSAQLCAQTQPALLTLPPNVTPTGLAWYDGAGFPPQYGGALYVALWNGRPPQVMRVVVGRRNGQPSGEAATFLSGLERPIDLLAHPEGGLLVLDYGAGKVYRVLGDEQNQ